MALILYSYIAKKMRFYHVSSFFRVTNNLWDKTVDILSWLQSFLSDFIFIVQIFT